MYSQDRQESEQIAAYQTAYQEGYLEKSSEFVMMAQLYLSQEAPAWCIWCWYCHAKTIYTR